jgi:hypothetical protein
MANNVIVYKNFDITKFEISTDVTKSPTDKDQVLFTYDGMKKWFLQGPEMTVPFGVSEFVPTNKQTGQALGAPSWSLQPSFKDADKDPKVAKFMEVLSSIDDKILNVASANSKKWMKEEMPPEVMKAFYTPLVRVNKKDPTKYAPTITVKLRKNDKDEFRAKAFDKKKQAFDLNDLQPHSKVKTLLNLTPVWFMNKGYGVSLNASQIVVTEEPENMNDYAFMDEVFEDDEGEEVSFKSDD